MQRVQAQAKPKPLKKLYKQRNQHGWFQQLRGTSRWLVPADCFSRRAGGRDESALEGRGRTRRTMEHRETEGNKREGIQRDRKRIEIMGWGAAWQGFLDTAQPREIATVIHRTGRVSCLRANDVSWRIWLRITGMCTLDEFRLRIVLLLRAGVGTVVGCHWIGILIVAPYDWAYSCSQWLFASKVFSAISHVTAWTQTQNMPAPKSTTKMNPWHANSSRHGMQTLQRISWVRLGNQIG